MPYLDHLRAEWHPDGAAVLNSDRGPRPPLAVPLATFTVHWTGAGRWADPGDTAAELLGIELNHARPTGKPNEYNSASDMEGVTWEYAGPFQAAHSAGENTTAWGHLVVLGPLDWEPGTPFPAALADAAIAGVRRARRQLVEAGKLIARHNVVPHRLMPDAETSCPGPLVENTSVWDRLAAPLGERPGPANVALRLPTIRPGDRNPHVITAKWLLRKFGQESSIDEPHPSEYGPRAAAGVRNVQRVLGLKEDGVIGPGETWPALLGLVPGTSADARR